MKHFIPEDGLYVYVRESDGKQVIVMMNGTDEEIGVDMTRYKESIPQGVIYTDVMTGADVMAIEPGNEPVRLFAQREILILESK